VILILGEKCVLSALNIHVRVLDMRISLYIFFLCMSVLISACARPEHVSISGSTTVLPVISKAAEMYSAEHGHTIIVNAGGSGAGFNQLAEGQTDIGMMSRDITASELEKFSDINFEVIAIGTVDNWSAFGGPDKAILVIDKEASSGTRHTFMEFVMGDKNAKAPGADLVLGSNNEEQTAITQSDSAIGMLSHAWLNKDVKGLAILQNGAPKSAAIQPTLNNIQNGDYPITRALNIIVRSDAAPETRAFVEYILSPDGQKHVTSSGYVKRAP